MSFTHLLNTMLWYPFVAIRGRGRRQIFGCIAWKKEENSTYIYNILCCLLFQRLLIPSNIHSNLTLPYCLSSLILNFLWGQGRMQIHSHWKFFLFIDSYSRFYNVIIDFLEPQFNGYFCHRSSWLFFFRFFTNIPTLTSSWDLITRKPILAISMNRSINNFSSSSVNVVASFLHAAGYFPQIFPIKVIHESIFLWGFKIRPTGRSNLICS